MIIIENNLSLTQFRAIVINSGHGTISSFTIRKSGSPDETNKYEVSAVLFH
jgi:hypothetical protein